MKRSIAIILSSIVVLLGMAPTADAEDAAAIKARMAKRLGQLVSLEKSGSIGENNQGYLTVRGNLGAAQAAVVKSENEDRRAVYRIIAAKTKTSLEHVGKARAASIRKAASKGTWVQLPSGHWQQK